MSDLRKALKQGGRDQIRGYGDTSLTELLPALLTSYNETELMIVAPAIPDQASEIIAKWAKWQWVCIDGRKIYVLQHLTIIADLSPEQSPMASEWLKENPFGDRLTLVDKAQDDTALLLPDIAITGPLNLRYGQNFTCDVTTVQEEVDALWKQYSKLTRPVAKSRATAKKAVSEPLLAPASPEAEEKIQEE